MGGTAAVWRATDERTGRPVAVKLLHPHLAADPAARERLQREALAMGGIDHPNVVAVRDLVLDDERPALIMDLVDGQSLADVIGSSGALSEPDALRVAAEIADGLAAVHAAGLVHRDLKPANILLGADGRARLTDLGIAASAEPGDAALTATDGVAGTLRYLAPERLQGEPAVPATDVWGLGVVLAEMLSGAPAFPATSIQARVGEVGRGVVRPEGIADPVWAIIERATADDPAARYPSAAAMAVDLRRLMPAAIVAAAAGGVDHSADTAVIPLPVAAASVIRAPAVAAPVGGLSASQRRRRIAPLIPLLGAAVLVLVIAVGVLGGSAADAPRGSGDPAAGASAPAATTVVATESPADPATDEDADADEGDYEKSGNGKGNAKGKGKDD